MTIVLFLVGILFLIVSLACIFRNPQYTIIGCILLIDIDFYFKNHVSQNLFQSALKLLVLMSVVLLLIKSRKGFNKGIIIINIVLLCISLVLLKKYQLSNFYVLDVLTSFLTTITGFLLMYVPWEEKIRIIGLKVLAWAAPFSAVMGIMGNGYIFTVDNKLPGMDSSPSLVIVSAIGLLSSYIVSSVYRQKKYFYIGILNFVVCGLCNMRGGLLFLCIVFLGMIFPYLKKVPKKLIKKIIFVSPVFLIAVLIMGQRIIQKTFDLSYSVANGGSRINTSNRIFAWTEILKATTQHRILGWGIGYTKKIEGIWLNYGYRAIHNEYIRWLVETGYVGVVGIIICFVFVFKFLKNNNIGINKSVIVALFVAFAIFSFTDNTMYASASWMTFSLIVSLMGKNIGRYGKTIEANNKSIRIKL